MTREHNNHIKSGIVSPGLHGLTEADDDGLWEVEKY